MSATSLALTAARMAWQEAEGDQRLLAGANVGVIVGSSRTLGTPALDESTLGHPVKELVYSSPVALAGEIARLLRCTGPCLATSSACASGVSALALAGDLLTAGSCDAVIVGAVDRATSPETARRFEKNGLVAPPEDNSPLPFDEESPGIHLADGAGFLLVERADASAPEVEHAVHLTGWAQRSHPQDRCGLKVATTLLGPCLEQALNRAQLTAQDLSFAYTHGNGNPRSDRNELEALKQFFAALPASTTLVATKQLTGHCLGATSAIEAAVTVRALQRKLCLPSYRILSADGGISATAKMPPTHASVHAFGLWGSCAVAVFSAQA